MRSVDNRQDAEPGDFVFAPAPSKAVVAATKAKEALALKVALKKMVKAKKATRGTVEASNQLDEQKFLELAVAYVKNKPSRGHPGWVQRFRHGWIPIGPDGRDITDPSKLDSQQRTMLEIHASRGNLSGKAAEIAKSAGLHPTAPKSDEKASGKSAMDRIKGNGPAAVSAGKKEEPKRDWKDSVKEGPAAVSSKPKPKAEEPKHEAPSKPEEKKSAPSSGKISYERKTPKKTAESKPAASKSAKKPIKAKHTISEFDSNDLQENGWLVQRDGSVAKEQMHGFYGELLDTNESSHKKHDNFFENRYTTADTPETIEEHHLRLLSHVHPAFQDQVREKLDERKQQNEQSGIFVGDGSVADLDHIAQYEDHSGDRDTPSDDGEQIDDRGLAAIGGINADNTDNGHYVVAMGTVAGQSVNMPAHEHGHAWDNLYGNASSSPEFVSLWNNYRNSPAGNSLNPYYGNPDYGNTEFWAEAYSAYNTAKAKGESDKALDTVMAKTLSLPGATPETIDSIVASGVVSPFREYFDKLVEEAGHHHD